MSHGVLKNDCSFRSFLHVFQWEHYLVVCALVQLPKDQFSFCRIILKGPFHDPQPHPPPHLAKKKRKDFYILGTV